MWELHLLGDRRLLNTSDRSARPVSVRCLELLALLVIQAGVPQPRERLAAALWPTSTDSQARTNLRRELHDLRLQLDCPALVVGNRTLTWEDNPVCLVDLRIFYHERDAARAALAAGEVAQAVQHALGALAAYVGELLPGIFDECVVGPRGDLHRDCVELCDVAAQGLREAGELEAARTVARRRVHLAPLEEVGYQALIALELEAGDRASALTTYHRCVETLDHELGVAPDDATTSLIEDLVPGRERDGLNAVRRDRARGAPFTGRGTEMEAITSRWHEAAAGESGLALVLGESGVGKSRLVRELASTVRAQGCVVVSTRCFGQSARVALAPVADWLRELDRQGALGGLDPVWQSEVARLLPGRARGGLPARQISPGDAVVESWRRHRFYEGLSRAVLNTGRPTLLVLDDMQWCDDETATWLAFFLQLARTEPVLVVCTARAEELSENAVVLELVRGIRSWKALLEVALLPLPPQETIALAEALLGRHLAAGERSLLNDTTAGLPFFVIQATLAAGGYPSIEAARVGKVLDDRLAQLSPTAREVAGLAAAVGRDFTLDLLTRASDLDADTVVSAVDELWQHRIVREQRAGYDFTHDLLRDAAYARVTPPRRWLTHRRIAQGLEQSTGNTLDVIAAQLAEQYERGGQPDRAIEHYLRAAATEASVFANTDAVRHYERALAIVEAGPDTRSRDREVLDLLVTLAPPLNAAFGYSSKRLESMLERTISLAKRLGEEETLVQSLVGLWAVKYVQGEQARSREPAVRALALARPGTPLAGQAHFAMGSVELSAGRPRVGATHLRAAVALTQDAPLSLMVGTRPEVHAQAWLAHALWLMGRADDARSEAAAAVERARTRDHPYSLAVALAYDGLTQHLLGDVPALLDAASELADLVERHRFAYYGEWAEMLRGWAQQDAAGARRIHGAIARLAARGSRARTPFWLSLEADVLARTGSTGAAAAVLGAAEAYAYAREDMWWLPEVLRMSAALDPGERGTDKLLAALELARRQGAEALAQRSEHDLAER